MLAPLACCNYYESPQQSAAALAGPPGITNVEVTMLHPTHVLAVVLSAVLPLAAAGPSRVRCDVQVSWICRAAGCKPGPVASEYLLVPNLGDLAPGAPALAGQQQAALLRCDGTGCQSLHVVAAERGSFITFSDPTGGYFARVTLSTVTGASERGALVETNAIGEQVTLRFGVCRLPTTA